MSFTSNIDLGRELTEANMRILELERENLAMKDTLAKAMLLAEMAGKLERDLAKTRLLAEAWEECAKTMNEAIIGDGNANQ